MQKSRLKWLFFRTYITNEQFIRFCGLVWRNNRLHSLLVLVNFKKWPFIYGQTNEYHNN